MKSDYIFSFAMQSISGIITDIFVYDMTQSTFDVFFYFLFLKE